MRINSAHVHKGDRETMWREYHSMECILHIVSIENPLYFVRCGETWTNPSLEKEESSAYQAWELLWQP